MEAARIIYAKFARRRARGERAWQNAKGRMRNAECPLAGRPDGIRAANRIREGGEARGKAGRRGERQSRPIGKQKRRPL